jgi:hypothetical protein
MGRDCRTRTSLKQDDDAAPVTAATRPISRRNVTCSLPSPAAVLPRRGLPRSAARWPGSRPCFRMKRRSRSSRTAIPGSAACSHRQARRFRNTGGSSSMGAGSSTRAATAGSGRSWWRSFRRTRRRRRADLHAGEKPGTDDCRRLVRKRYVRHRQQHRGGRQRLCSTSPRAAALPEMVDASYPPRHNQAERYFNYPLASVLVVIAGGTPLPSREWVRTVHGASAQLRHCQHDVHDQGGGAYYAPATG